MRRRELIARLKDEHRELRRAAGGLFTSKLLQQQRAERRLFLLHALENLLPEIIEKLETRA
jgi:hypothetical protein